MKRAGLALGSALCAGIIFNGAAWTLAPDTFHDLFHSDQPVYLTVLFMLALLVATVLPWWLLALPLVLSISRAEGWRLWFIGICGTLIGPALAALFLAFMIFVGKSPAYSTFTDPQALILFPASLIPSAMATAIYLSILKLSSRKTLTSNV
jgi:hypothetical protein